MQYFNDCLSSHSHLFSHSHLTRRLPDQVKPTIAQLTAHLDGDSYTMRKYVPFLLLVLLMKFVIAPATLQ